MCKEILGENKVLTNVSISSISEQRGNGPPGRKVNGLVNLNKIETRKSNFHSINNVLVKLE